MILSVLESLHSDGQIYRADVCIFAAYHCARAKIVNTEKTGYEAVDWIHLAPVTGS